MDWLEQLVRFTNSYPLWSRILVCIAVAVIVFTLILAPRRSSVQTSGMTADTNKAGLHERWLIVQGVELFGSGASSYEGVRVSAKVNGVTYIYPTFAGIEWLEVGPDMAPQQFKLPPSDRGYDLQFSMTAKQKGAVGKAEYVNVEFTHVDEVPYVGTYRLYLAKWKGRSAAPSAAVKYKTSTVPQ